jgi:Uncharacterized protein conserved in bacteria (DUF2325)
MNTPDDAGDTVPGWTFGTRGLCCAPTSMPARYSTDSTDSIEATDPDPATGSRRRRLWDLESAAHCPVVGVCLPMPVLRRLARKVLGVETTVDAYALHCSVVAECKRRGLIADAIQRELDQRFGLALRQTATLKTTEMLTAWWDAQDRSTDLPGALWATLTHARCTRALADAVLGQVHMLQHQVGMASRVELARFEALIDENAVLARELAAAQARSSKQAGDHAVAVGTLQAEAVRLRGQKLAADSQVALLREDLQALRESVPDLDSRAQLAQRLATQNARCTELQRALQAARSDIERLSAAALITPPETGDDTDDRTAVRATPPAAPIALADRAVLCVGGRSSAVPVYRRLVEACGARFEHHDGGQQHNTHQLDHTLSAADLVICQAGCISHNAYWRVKDHCKRTGKRCIYVDNPSAASLQRALAEVLAPPATVTPITAPTASIASITIHQERPA